MSSPYTYSFFCDDCNAKFSDEYMASIDCDEYPELIDCGYCIYCIDNVKSEVLAERSSNYYEPTEYDEWMSFDPDC
jgi:hypothetical protein